MPLELVRWTSGRDVKPLMVSVAFSSSASSAGSVIAERNGARREDFDEFVERLATKELVERGRLVFQRVDNR